MLDGIDSPPVHELQLRCGHYYLSDIAPASVSFEDCSLDDAVPLDRASVAYDCWLEALEALHPGHRFRGFGLSDAELADDGLLERLLLTVLFDGGSCRFIRSVVAVVNGYRARRG